MNTYNHLREGKKKKDCRKYCIAAMHGAFDEYNELIYSRSRLVPRRQVGYMGCVSYWLTVYEYWESEHEHCETTNK
jgi:hypothetical protein